MKKSFVFFVFVFIFSNVVPVWGQEIQVACQDWVTTGWIAECKARLIYSDGRKVDITQKAVWGISPAAGGQIQKGIFIAGSLGNAVISATYGGRGGKDIIDVRKELPEVKVFRFFSGNPKEAYPGEYISMYAEVFYENGCHQVLDWGKTHFWSSDGSVAGFPYSVWYADRDWRSGLLVTRNPGVVKLFVQYPWFKVVDGEKILVKFRATKKLEVKTP